jgi:protein SCO1/2
MAGEPRGEPDTAPIASFALPAVEPGLLPASLGGSDVSQKTFLMPRRLAALVAALAVGLAGCGGGVAAAGGSKGLDGVGVSLPAKKPDIVLTATTGRPYNVWAATQGYVTLLFFGYTHCPDECPTHMANIATALRHMSPSVARHVKVLFVTTDPHRDTAPVLRAWLNNFSQSFIGLSGTFQQIQTAETDVGLPLATAHPLPGGGYSVQHAAVVLAFTTDNLSHVVYPSGLGTAAWLHDLPKLVKGWPAA